MSQNFYRLSSDETFVNGNSQIAALLLIKENVPDNHINYR